MKFFGLMELTTAVVFASVTLAQATNPTHAVFCNQDAFPASKNSDTSLYVKIEFDKSSGYDALDLCWIDFSGNLVSYGTLSAAKPSIPIQTFATHPWVLRNASTIKCSGKLVSPAPIVFNGVSGSGTGTDWSKLYPLSVSDFISTCAKIPTNLVRNPSFEAVNLQYCDPAYPMTNGWCLSKNPDFLPGWTVTDSAKMVEIDQTPWPAHDGKYSVDLSGNEPISLKQTIQGAKAFSNYKVSFKLRVNPCGGSVYSGYVHATGGERQAFSYVWNSSHQSWDTVDYYFVALTDDPVLEIGSTKSGSCGPVIDSVSMVESPIPNMVFNPSFEIVNLQYCDPAYPMTNGWCLSKNPDFLPGWTVTDPKKMVEIDQTPWPAQDGKYSVDLSGSEPYSLKQTIQGAKSGSYYKVSFKLRVNPLCQNQAVFTGYVNATGGERQAFSYLWSATHQTWDTVDYYFIASTEAPVLEIGSTTGSGCGPVIDNVSMVETKRTNLVFNPSFESVDFSLCSQDTPIVSSGWCLSKAPGFISYWSVTDPSKRAEIDITPWQAPDGRNSMDLSGETPYAIQQKIQGAKAGSYYKVSFQLRVNPCGGSVYTGYVNATGGDRKAFSYEWTATHQSWDTIEYFFQASTNTPTLEIGSTKSGSCGPVIDDVLMFEVEKPRNMIGCGVFYGTRLCM